jgi:hypothetical protein
LTIDGRGAYQGDRFLSARGSIVAIPQQRHFWMRRQFYTTIFGFNI